MVRHRQEIPLNSRGSSGNVTFSGNWTGPAEDCFAAAAFCYLGFYRAGLNPSINNGGVD